MTSVMGPSQEGEDEDEPGTDDDTSTSLLLLKKWLSHDTVDFHRFDDDTERKAFQTELLDWYRSHRRRLPWRGDPSPWTGSTAQFANNVQKKKDNKKIVASLQAEQDVKQSSTTKKKKQTKLSALFIVGSLKNPSSEEPEPKTKKQPTAAATEEEDHTDTDRERCFPVTPYGIWVSEIMLQQTRVEAVVAYWCKWMEAFPTVQALAAATPEQVNAHWAGLGFYRRARFLHSAAQWVVTQHDGVVPDTVAALMTLPGIGRYTASAIASVAFGATNTPVVDGNVCRVLSRMRAISQCIKAPLFKDKLGWTIAESLVQDCCNHDDDDTAASGDLNQALMELGATYCAPSGTGVDENDPALRRYWSVKLQRQVTAHRRHGGGLAELEALILKDQSSCPLCTNDGIRESLHLMWEAATVERGGKNNTSSRGLMCGGHAGFPLAPPEAKKREEVLVVAVLRNGDRWLLTRRPEKGLLGGQWEFPNQCVWKSVGKQASKTIKVPEFAVSKRRTTLTELMRTIFATANVTWQNRLDVPIEHVFSHVRHTMWIECGEISDSAVTGPTVTDDSNHTARWMSERDMANVGVTSGVKKIMAAVDVLQKSSASQPKKKRKR
jgi:A/G-specific adenine glycosylase